MTAFGEGYLAYCDGKEPHNPYREGTLSNENWWHGWYTAAYVKNGSAFDD